MSSNAGLVWHVAQGVRVDPGAVVDPSSKHVILDHRSAFVDLTSPVARGRQRIESRCQLQHLERSGLSLRSRPRRCRGSEVRAHDSQCGSSGNRCGKAQCRRAVPGKVDVALKILELRLLESGRPPCSKLGPNSHGIWPTSHVASERRQISWCKTKDSLGIKRAGNLLRELWVDDGAG